MYAAAACAYAPRLYAQFSWSFFSDLNVRLVSWMVPTGERAEKLITVNNNILPNSNTNTTNPANTRGDYTYTSGTLDLFNYNRVTMPNNARLTVEYRNQSVALYTRANLENLFRADVTENQGTGRNEMAGGHSFVQGSGRTPDWGDFLRYSFIEWNIRGNLGWLMPYVGNTDNTGRVRQLNPFTDDLMLGIKVDNYGVNTPGMNVTDFQHDGMDINNFRRGSNINSGGNYSFSAVPYIMLGARFEKFGFPLIFQIAADPGSNIFTGAALNYRRFGGAARISGENVAKRITFDAIYKFRGGDPNTLDNYDPDYYTGGTLQPNGDGLLSHNFGVYANVLNVPNWNFGIGYSGYLKAFEDTENKTTGVTTAKTGPLFSGIDLRFQYTGFSRTVITFHNNISFAVTDKAASDNVAIGIWGQNLTLGTEQSWFALYNALGISYRWNEALTFTFQAGSRLGIATTMVTPAVGDDYVYQRSLVKIGGGGFAAYQFNRNLLILGGFGIRWVNNSYINSAAGAQNDPARRDADGGTFEVSIPIRVRITFRS